MEVYGLTGGIGSGKSTVAAMLEEYGVPVVSADELSRMVVAPGSEGLADVVEAFGREVLDERGELDRKRMGKIVFANADKRRALEAILHPRIRERYEQVLDALEKAGHPVMVYEVPLLFEKKLHLQDEMKAVILVASSADNRIARVKDRDALTTEEVLARMRAQLPEDEKRRLADYIVLNDGDLDDLRREVEYLISRYLKLPSREERAAEVELDVLPVDAPAVALHDERPGELDVHPTGRMGGSMRTGTGTPLSRASTTASSETYRGPAPTKPSAAAPEPEPEELEELDAVEELDEAEAEGEPERLEVALHDAGPNGPQPGRRPTMPIYGLDPLKPEEPPT
jgi:dephospho-CoA kinase